MHDIHQLHSVENRNRRERLAGGAVPINISAPHIDPLEGAIEVAETLRATVVPLRTLKGEIPVTCTYDGALAEDDKHDDPVNVLGPIMAQNVPVVTNNDFSSFIAAVNKRCDFLHKDDIDEGVLAEAMALLDALEPKARALFDDWDENSHDRERWLAKFGPVKQARMRAAYDDLDMATTYQLGTKDLQVKKEVLCGKRDDDSWAPRIINAGSDAYNAFTGPGAMVVMERTQFLFEHDNHCVRLGDVEIKFCYKTTDVSIGEFLTQREDLIYTNEGDFSRNDSEQRASVTLLMDRVLELLRMPDWFRLFHIKIRKYKVRSRFYEFSAIVENQLPTGGTNTTWRNSWFNGIQFAVVCRRMKITAARACILGDDILARTREMLLEQPWKDIVALFKMVLKGSSPRLHGQATLLSMRCFADREVPCFMPKLGKALNRFNVRATVNQAVSDSQYMAGKALSYAYSFRHVPIIRDAFLRRFRSEDHVNVQLDELTWFVRSSGVTAPDELLRLIKAEKVLLSEDETMEFMVEFYELDLYDLDALLKLFVESRDPGVVETPLAENLLWDL